uniref:Integrin_alpha2 domain-containing protein n=1 Tax=Trichuris muris TaxID=70415 RepID=A0A5S6QJD1_TRIMR
MAMAAVLLLYYLTTPCGGFNLDVDFPVYKVGPPDTFFGFAVAQHFRNDEPLLLIGAPKAESGQVGTEKAGALFSCPINTISREQNDSAHGARWCERSRIEYPTVDRSAGVDYYSKPPNAIRPEDIYTKNHQWLGSTVCSSGRGSRVLVCAPNLIYETAAYIEGACFLLRNDLSHVKRIRTCQAFTKKNRHNDYGACQEGFSAALSEKHEVVATGLPGANRWTGGAFAQDIDEALSTLHSRWTAMVRGDHAVESVVKAHSYFGYSISVGIFGFWFERAGPNGNLTLVAGCPRCNETGAVYFMPFRKEVTVNDYSALRLLSDNFNLTGDQSLASGFGYSVCVVDINNDGFDDLVVGAPYFYGITSTEVYGGRAYVYFSAGFKQPKDLDTNVFQEAIRLSGPKDSMFGASIANLGDINNDQFNDVAIGAPYHEAGGAVYIYLGADRSDFEQKPIQVILGNKLHMWPLSKPLETFGWSLSGGTDLDSNGYPDLLVGAFKSDVAILLRARPIIHVVASVEESDLTPIDVDSQQCSEPWAKACVRFRTSLRVKRQVVGPQLDFSENILMCRLKVLSHGTSALRAEFSQSAKYEKEWPCGAGAVERRQEKEHELFIRDSNRDWLNPLKFELSVSLSTSEPEFSTSPFEPVDINDHPVLDKKGSKKEFTIEFNKKCGPDNKCISDLSLQCFFVDLAREPSSDVYVKQVGKDDELDLQYRLVNKGERAYESSLFVLYNEDELERPMLLQKAHHRLNFGKFENGLIEVLLGNPLEADAEIVFSLKFKLTRGRSEGLGDALIFDSYVNSTSIEKYEDDNRCTASVKVIKKAELEIVGTSEPQLVYFGGKSFGQSAVDYEEDIGPQVVHTYLVRNGGPWGVNDVTVIIDHPHQIGSTYGRGKWALYLMYLPIIELPVPGSTVTETRNCYVDSMADYVNPLEIKGTYWDNEVADVSKSKRQIGSAEDESEETIRNLNGKRRQHFTTPEKSSFLSSISAPQFRAPTEVVEEGGETYTRAVISCHRQGQKRTASCFKIRCFLDYLEPNITATIRVRSRLWNSTFVEDYRHVDHVLIESHATVDMNRLQGIEETNYLDNEATAVTRVQPDMPKIAEKKKVPLWIIILAVLGGIFLLLLVIIVLWKCGFFKRRNYYDKPLYTAEYKRSDDYD